jgi:hypothetical protein
MSKDDKKPEQDKPFSLHGMTPVDAIRKAFATKPTYNHAGGERERVIQKLASQIYLHVPSSASNRTYQLPCRNTGCYSMGKISAAKHQHLTDTVKEKLASHFYQQGWRYSDGPICPDCAREAKENG